MKDTAKQFDIIIEKCKQIYITKIADYGVAWRVLRLSSLTDQIYIKALRIRSIEEKGTQKIKDTIAEECMGILNYSIIALIQLKKGIATKPDLSTEEAIKLYNQNVIATKELMLNKNHDYAEAWRTMRTSSITDIIIQKLLRIKQIEDNQGKTIISEGLETNYQDIINYCIFSLILQS